jgi:hypothetical protein
MKSRRYAALLSFLLALLAPFTARSYPLQLSTTGTGQVLLFPYYAAHGETVSLISLVNTTAQGKAVRVNFRESRNGVLVLHMNVYLSSRDTWTAALIRDMDGAARIVTADRSCTSPKIPSVGLTFSAAGYRNDSVNSVERSRDGYVEVIEMATIPLPYLSGSAAPPSNSIGVDIEHQSGTPPCKLVASASFVPAASELTAPSGGLMGTLSLVNPSRGMLTTLPTTAIDNFWATDANNPTVTMARVAAANDTSIDLTSGGNVWSTFLTEIDPAPLISSTLPSSQGKSQRVTARFANSLDAVSSIMMIDAASSEYATTSANEFMSSLVIAFPTKHYYLRVNISEPFKSPWSAATATACDAITGRRSFDREEFDAIYGDVFYGAPPDPPELACFVANTYTLNRGTGALPYLNWQTASPTFRQDDSMLAANNASRIDAIQGAGATFVPLGKEGGWLSFQWDDRGIDTVEAFVLLRQGATYKTEAIKLRLTGVPAIGFVHTQFELGVAPAPTINNYADAVRINTRSTSKRRP